MITQKELKKELNYNKKTGIFMWRKKCSGRKFNGIVGTVNIDGYIMITVNKTMCFAHRLAWLYEYGELPKQEIDHINRIKTDNRLCNLRDVSHQENMENIPRLYTLSKGVTWHKLRNKWVAFMKINGKQKHLGYFEREEDAVVARKEFELTLCN